MWPLPAISTKKLFFELLSAPFAGKKNIVLTYSVAIVDILLSYFISKLNVRETYLSFLLLSVNDLFFNANFLFYSIFANCYVEKGVAIKKSNFITVVINRRKVKNFHLLKKCFI